MKCWAVIRGGAIKPDDSRQLHETIGKCVCVYVCMYACVCVLCSTLHAHFLIFRVVVVLVLVAGLAPFEAAQRKKKKRHR